MEIHGLNKTTLLDYPGRVASTVFTGACNFRCPFCQNGDLVMNPMGQPFISEEEVFAHLDKRKGVITGVCITGGEPTLQKDLGDFARRLKERGLAVKLDTNGYKPEVVRGLLEEGLLDYIAMDIKSGKTGYSKVAGVEVNIEKICESVELIMNSGLDYEFRTTVVRDLHGEEDFAEIGEMLRGAKKYFLQCYVDSERVLKKGMTAYSYDEMEGFKKLIGKNVENIAIRGL